MKKKFPSVVKSGEIKISTGVGWRLGLAGKWYFAKVGALPRGAEPGAGTSALQVRVSTHRPAISRFEVSSQYFQLRKILSFDQGGDFLCPWFACNVIVFDFQEARTNALALSAQIGRRRDRLPLASWVPAGKRPD